MSKQKNPTNPKRSEPPKPSTQIKWTEVQTTTVILAAIGWLKDFTRFGFLFLIALCFYWSIEKLSGKQTQANISLWGGLSLNDAVAAIFGCGGTAYGIHERVNRKRHVKRMSETIARLENLIDANRSSSNLSPYGDTNPEDLS